MISHSLLKTRYEVNMHEDNPSRSGAQKLVSVLQVIARFAVPIQIFVFLGLAGMLSMWLTVPVAHAISAFLVSLPFYWTIQRRKIRYSTYVVLCGVFAAGLAFIEYLLLGW